MPLRMLAIATAYNRIGYVLLIGDTLVDWRISDRAASSTTKAVAWVQRYVDELRPDVIVTENPKTAKKKGHKTIALIEAVGNFAENKALLNVMVARRHDYDNKYDEADALAALYPDLKPWVQRRRWFYDNEPRNTVIFEALSLALSVLRDPSKRLAAAMG